MTVPESAGPDHHAPITERTMREPEIARRQHPVPQSRRRRIPAGAPPWPVLAILLAALLAPAAGYAQAAVRPELEWRTVRTEHFDLHYPAPAERWTLEVARRMEAVRTAVAEIVGFAPAARVTVIVEDPANVPNGFAIPLIDQSTIVLWPTPVAAPNPLANNRSWWDILAIHEFAHVAHLTRESRNPIQRLLWRLAPARLGPVARRSPRWLTEGYATYVEGRLTSSGRPNSAGRASILRQWALEGRLPSYGALNASSGFYAGSMAYLAGSAYLEWLDERAQRDSAHGRALAPGESFTLLWRRMSARVDRGFDEAFRGVYGESPAALYARFTTEVTGNALAIRDSLAAAGTRQGRLVQRLTYGTGEPAISPDGQLLALVVRDREHPPRLTILAIAGDSAATADSAAAARRAQAEARMLARDPEDVAAIQRFPRPRRVVASLATIDGRAPDRPRFMPNGREVLLVRTEPTGDGSARGDLFLWNFRTDALRRITTGAGIREADPAPDGRSAVGVRCEWGICDVVRIDLSSGATTVIAGGSPDVQFAGVRHAADGRVVVAQQWEGTWRPVLIDRDGSARPVGPADGASRYTPAFTADGGALVTASERGGLVHLERLDLATGAVSPLTRSTGAHFAPEPTPDGRDLYFLALHAGGHDLYRLDAPPGTAESPFGPALGDRFGGDGRLALAPAAPSRLGGTPVEFTTAPVTPHDYREAPRLPLALPLGETSADGTVGGLILATADPVGRLGLLAEGGTGDRSAWRGGRVAGEWRRWPVRVQGELFSARNEPGLNSRATGHAASGALDAEQRGGLVALAWRRQLGSSGASARVGGFAARLDPLGTADPAARGAAFAEMGLAAGRAHDRRFFNQTLRLSGAAGRTDAAAWQRGSATGTLAAGLARAALSVSATLGAISASAPIFEQFAVGGGTVRFVDHAVLGQRVAVPALPTGTLVGDRLFLWRAELTRGLPLGLVPFYLSASTSRGFDVRQRVAGLEWRATFDAIPYVRLPHVDVQAGWSRVLDGPDRGRNVFHAGVAYRP